MEKFIRFCNSETHKHHCASFGLTILVGNKNIWYGGKHYCGKWYKKWNFRGERVDLSTRLGWGTGFTAGVISRSVDGGPRIMECNILALLLNGRKNFATIVFTV